MSTEEKPIAYQGDEPYVFVSYARKDRKLADKFIVELQKHYRVWFDEGLHYGEKWAEEIEDRIVHSSIFLYLITEASLRPASYCRQEIKTAQKCKKPFINIIVNDNLQLPKTFEKENKDYQMCNLFQFKEFCDAVEDLSNKTKILQSIRLDKYSQGLKIRDGVLLGIGICEDKNIVIPDYVTRIGREAFEKCEQIEHVKITSNIRYIDENAFAGCRFLQTVEIDDGCVAIGARAFAFCLTLSQISIPNSVERIDDNAFFGCKGLKSIKLPENMVSVNDSLFYDCENLSEIIMPSSIETIGDNSFNSCVSLESIVIPNNVRSIGKDAFCGCDKLKSVIIPDNLKKIEDNAFCGCKSLESVSVPSALKEIGLRVFQYCYKLSYIEFRGKKIFGEVFNLVCFSDYRNEVGDYIIHCTDGDIKK